MDMAEFGKAEREVFVGMNAAVIGEHSTRAVHRFDGVILLVDLGGVHVLFVVIPVAGSLPELPAHHGWGVDFLVTVLRVDLSPLVEELIHGDHAVRKEEWHAWSVVAEHE